MVPFPQQPDDITVVFCLVRPDAVGADLQLLPILLLPGIRAGAVLHLIEGAVAEEAVDLIKPLVAGVELTFLIGEEAIRVFHFIEMAMHSDHDGLTFFLLGYKMEVPVR